MICLRTRRVHAIAITAAAILCLPASQKLVAANPDTAPNVTYTASGTFDTTPISGADVFKLAGQTFSISVVVNAATAPTSHGAQWAKYTNQSMTGSVNSGLIPGQPIPLKSTLTSIELAMGNPNYDVFTMFAPVDVLNGTLIYITANIQMPEGTITKPLVHPFAAIALGPCTLPAPPGPCVDTVVYADPSKGTSTTLGIQNGTLVGTIPGGGVNQTAAVANLQLHSNGVQAINVHADGSQTVRPMGATALEMGEASDIVELKFYASGVREGSAVHVQIAGRDVPIVYAGPAGYFAGLDEVTVKVPRSMAGSGDVDVALTVDGHTASPVHIQIQ